MTDENVRFWIFFLLFISLYILCIYYFYKFIFCCKNKQPTAFVEFLNIFENVISLYSCFPQMWYCLVEMSKYMFV